MLKNLKHSWKTSLIGVFILLAIAYQIVINKQEPSIMVMVEALIAAGFLAAKDVSDSHTKRD